MLLYNPFEDQGNLNRLAPLVSSIFTLRQAGLEIALFITWDGETFHVSAAEPTGDAVESWFMKFSPGDAEPVLMRLVPRESYEAVRALIEDGTLVPADPAPGHDPDPEFN